MGLEGSTPFRFRHMFRCILCLKTFDDADASDEHVFPDAIGGLLKLKEMCVPCNSHLGEVIDAPLVNHRYVQWSRRNLKLATRAGRIPNPLDRGEVPTTGQRVRWEPDGRVYYHPSRQQDEDGGLVLRVDQTDQHLLPNMLDKARQRRGVDVRGEVIRPGAIESLSFELGFDDEDYRFGILKIAYELGCKVLGPAYLDDPLAARIRSVLAAETRSRELLDAACIPGRIGGLYGSAMVQLIQYRESWLAGVVFRQSSRVHAYVRLFDRFDASFVLSENAAGYACSETGVGWLTDVAERTIRETSIEELRNLATDLAD